MTNDELGVFYEKFFGRLYSFARKLTGHHQDAEDLVQDAFVAKMDKIKNWDNGEYSLFEYLKIVINGLYLSEGRK